MRPYRKAWPASAEAIGRHSPRRRIHSFAAVVCVLAPATGLAAQDVPKKDTQDVDIKGVIDVVRKREKALKAATFSMTTRGRYAAGLEFSTRGTIRVLGTTHFHIRVESTFAGEEGSVRSLVETVITPDGLTSKQRGLTDRDIYTVMDKKLMLELQAAERELSKDRGAAMRSPGPLAGNGDAVLGSAMLKSFDLQFEFKESTTPVEVGGVACRRLIGSWRGAVVAKNRRDRAVHRVDVFLRKTDGLPIRFVQYYKKATEGGGAEAVDAVAAELNIQDLVLDPKLDPKSFKLEIPKGVTPIPVMDHRPSRAQIDRILQEYEALKKERTKEKKGG